MTVTFLRTRPAELISEVTARTRLREGTTALEVEGLTDEDRVGALSGGVLPVAVGISDVEPIGWVVDPVEAVEMAGRGVAGWRMTVTHQGPRASILDAVARSAPAFLRTGRAAVADAASIVTLPGITTVVSVFVDTLDHALTALEDGAGDLLLRDWGIEQIGELREALGQVQLIERTALPVGVSVDAARGVLDGALFKAYLDQIDGSGAARPRTVWSPGKSVALPAPSARLSSEWADDCWVQGKAAISWRDAGLEVQEILGRSLEGLAPTRDELEALFKARGRDVEAIAWTADQLRIQAVGDTVTYVVNRNINYTNVCYFRCGFCAFSKGPRSLNLRGEPYLMEISEIVERSRQAWDRGATEVTLQGGIHPHFTGDFYVEVVEAIKADLPDIHIHGFTPLEVWQGAETLGVPVAEFLARLARSGLGTLPGTAAEVLDDRIRAHLCPDKIRTAQWAEVMFAAHEVGLRSTATLMFGHIDDPASWANHFEVIRTIQRRTGGFTEFVPLPFVHMGSPIYLRGRARPGPTWDEIVLVHAVARIAFDRLIPNIQASWVKLGLDGGARLLAAGCNDLGGTLMDETITRAAGAVHGQETSPRAFEQAISSIGRSPAQRNTIYEILAEAL
ncbi:MAG: 5-amino-6-(D-ribitylamino)uracil--L-tyrosine 4-hydroxyphenyl transferase CofH [Acidimicrobiia bacterium]|nr:5-amino-6-(D-ribitylamino)uracil--L-tyrosine 4-hydroxyphenyl transferase CofH [Acidimicrobiia bacterium]